VRQQITATSAGLQGMRDRQAKHAAAAESAAAQFSQLEHTLIQLRSAGRTAEIMSAEAQLHALQTATATAHEHGAQLSEQLKAQQAVMEGLEAQAMRAEADADLQRSIVSQERHEVALAAIASSRRHKACALRQAAMEERAAAAREAALAHGLREELRALEEAAAELARRGDSAGSSEEAAMRLRWSEASRRAARLEEGAVRKDLDMEAAAEEAAVAETEVARAHHARCVWEEAASLSTTLSKWSQKAERLAAEAVQADAEAEEGETAVALLHSKAAFREETAAAATAAGRIGDAAHEQEAVQGLRNNAIVSAATAATARQRAEVLRGAADAAKKEALEVEMQQVLVGRMRAELEEQLRCTRDVAAWAQVASDATNAACTSEREMQAGIEAAILAEERRGGILALAARAWAGGDTEGARVARLQAGSLHEEAMASHASAATARQQASTAIAKHAEAVTSGTLSRQELLLAQGQFQTLQAALRLAKDNAKLGKQLVEARTALDTAQQCAGNAAVHAVELRTRAHEQRQHVSALVAMQETARAQEAAQDSHDLFMKAHSRQAELHRFGVAIVHAAADMRRLRAQLDASTHIMELLQALVQHSRGQTAAALSARCAHTEAVDATAALVATQRHAAHLALQCQTLTRNAQAAEENACMLRGQGKEGPAEEATAQATSVRSEIAEVAKEQAAAATNVEARREIVQLVEEREAMAEEEVRRLGAMVQLLLQAVLAVTAYSALAAERSILQGRERVLQLEVRASFLVAWCPLLLA
jgi:hypothetical protein